MNNSQITHWCHEVIRSQVKRGGLYIDATMGNGYDTVFLAELAGDEGRVLAFDIQKQALESTKKRLADLSKSAGDRCVSLYLDSHENMDQYVEKESVDLIVFNFGYLPGGDHALATKPESSVKAIEKGLTLLSHGGMMSLCIYSGGDTGFEEKNQILEMLKHLPQKEFTVIVNSYWNRENNPPIPAFIFKK